MTMPAANIAEYTVSEISAAVKRAVEDGFSYVRVRGEISGFRGPHSSGHCYFSLKDERARLEACVWRLTYQRLRFKPQEGLEVIAVGRLTTFPGQSKYQIIVDSLEPAGVGALMALLEERRRTLAAEGLFDERRKRPLPFLPRTVGVVTSPTGAVIRDILHRLADRFPVNVLVWPVKVQGEASAAEVAAAIRGFNALSANVSASPPDLIIVARGGGSLEDLWSFNEEVVVRAVAASTIPVISAVGHETDWTLIDHVADRRAPTPSAAAEMAVPVRGELLVAVQTLGVRHTRAIARAAELKRRELLAAARALPRPDSLLAIPRRAVDELGNRLGRGLTANAQAHRVHLTRAAARLSPSTLRQLLARRRAEIKTLADRQRRSLTVCLDRHHAGLVAVGDRLRVAPIAAQLERHRHRLAELKESAKRAMTTLSKGRKAQLDGVAQLLRTLSYRSVLARGFALVRAGDRPVHAAARVAAGSALDIEFADGHVAAVVTSGTPKPRRKKAIDPASGESQGSLF